MSRGQAVVMMVRDSHQCRHRLTRMSQALTGRRPLRVWIALVWSPRPRRSGTAGRQVVGVISTVLRHRNRLLPLGKGKALVRRLRDGRRSAGASWLALVPMMWARCWCWPGAWWWPVPGRG